jgi:K+-sensing histidine kinase KdpD
VDTYFATPQRSDNEELLRQIDAATNNPIVDGIMCLVGGLIAVLNQNRQIVTANHRMLEALGVSHPSEITGLRPGEVLGCIYADETPSGCGTSAHCVTCGAAVAIVATLGTQGPVDNTCSITIEKQGQQFDLFFNIHASTFKLGKERFVLIFLQDMTRQQQQAALERAFFHDIKNTIMGLLNASEILSRAPSHETAEMVDHIFHLSKRLSKEVELQRHLKNKEDVVFGISHESFQVDAFLKEMQKAVSHHPSKKSNRLKITNSTPGIVLKTDLSLLMRVMANMLINAFEADESDQEVLLNVNAQGDEVVFSVWNHTQIHPSIRRRIFQRNFSTKNELGRGLGTYSMKLIGEQLLGGRVYFESEHEKGTRFYLALPIDNKLSGALVK